MWLYDDIVLGWDTTCCGPTPGGIWWDKQHTQKATASNAGPVITAVKLYNITGNHVYLDFAQMVWEYWAQNMVNANTGQVCDHILTNGTRVWWKYTYNEGLMIGASVIFLARSFSVFVLGIVCQHSHQVHLYLATLNSSYLDFANLIAGFVLSQETENSAYGPVLSDGSAANCQGDCMQFKGPAFRFLAQFTQVSLLCSFVCVCACVRAPVFEQYGYALCAKPGPRPQRTHSRTSRPSSPC
jgi:predicted alpha-1,6-mannanase (GH76 family)